MSRAGFKHWAMQFGGYGAQCTRCKTIVHVCEDALMAEDWWAAHAVSSQHTNIATRRKR